MGVRDIYLVIKKIVDYPELFTDKRYETEYQMCEVIQSGENSGVNVGESILIGNRIQFESAEYIGKDLFFIYLEDVYGVIRNDTIIPLEDYVYIETNKDRKSTIKYGDMELYNDTSYNPLDKDNVVQDGFVLSVCQKAKDDYFKHELKIEIEPGDKVYTHHFLTDPDNERSLNGKKYYETKYEDLYCKIIGEDIVMLNEWNFVTPVEKIPEVSETGIELDFTQKNQIRIGIINYTSESLINKGVRAGDKIFFKTGREYEIDVEGKTYYRINTRDIIFKIE